MKLEFSGAPEVTAPRQVVWDRLMDPQFVAASAPGVESVEAVDPHHDRSSNGRYLLDDRYRARHVLEDPLGDRPEQQTLEAAHAAGSDHQQVGAGARLEQGRGRKVVHDLEQHLNARAC